MRAADDEQMKPHPTSSPSPWRLLLNPSPRQRQHMLYWEAWILVGATMGAMAFAYLWPHDFRNGGVRHALPSMLSFMLRTFQFHIALVVLAVAAAALWRRCWKLAAVALAVAACCLQADLSSALPGDAAPNSPDELVVLSANLLVSNDDLEPLIEQIELIEPHVVFFQEYSPKAAGALRDRLVARLPHVAEAPRADAFGMALYSALPFEKPVETHLPLGDGLTPQMRAVVLWRDDEVALCNIHLMPPGGLMHFQIGRKEFADLAQHLQQEPLPSIVAGDFNFTDTSPQSHVLRGELGYEEAHIAAGSGRGATWPKLGLLRFAPGLRLDHFYFSRTLRCRSCSVLPRYGSDHLPVVARFSWRK